MAAQSGARELRAICPRVAFSSLFHNWVFTGGAFQLAFNLRWAAVQMHSRTNQIQYLWMPPEVHYERFFEHLPLMGVEKVTGRHCHFYREWIEHWQDGPFWDRLGNLENKYGVVDVAAYHFGGWYDVFLQGTINNFTGMREHGKSERVRRGQKLLIGPWIHSLGERGTERKTGDVDFGDGVLVDLLDEELRWFEYWLKGVDSGIQNDSPVRVFVMGRNQWRQADGWPIPGTKFVNLYLANPDSRGSVSAWGKLENAPARRSLPDTFEYDPADPVPTMGGSTCCSEEVTPVSMGPRDQSSVHARRDVLLYATDPLREGIEVTGPLKVTLYASSSAKDTDFTAKLVDIFPRGFAMNIAQGIIRARFRDSFENPSLLEPGRVYKFEVDCWSASNYFAKGHRIGLEISSSNFPQFDRNLNTGGILGTETKGQKALQRIFHDAGRPSHVTLPIVRDEIVEE